MKCKRERHKASVSFINKLGSLNIAGIMEIGKIKKKKGEL